MDYSAMDPHKRIENLEKLHEQGKISYDEMVDGQSKQLDRLQKRCNHSTTEVEWLDGRRIVWCANDDCSIKLDDGRGSTGSHGSAVKVKGGCAIVAITLVGGVAAVGWSVLEAARSIL